MGLTIPTDWPWVISFTVNSGLSLFLQLIPVFESLLTRCDCLHRAKKKVKKVASTQCMYPRMAVSHTADAVWAVQLVSCLNATDKWREKSIRQNTQEAC